MRFRLLLLGLLVILVLGPSFAQGPDEPTEIKIDLVGDDQKPTTVITGQKFEVILRIRYLDLRRDNKEIVVFTDKINKTSIASHVGSLFNVLEVNVSGPMNGSDEEIWREIKMTMNIIPDLDFEELYARNKTDNPELQALLKLLGPMIKTTSLEISPIALDWGIKEVGQNEGEIEMKKSVHSPPIYLNHVFTTPDDPALQIRDGFNIGYRAGGAVWFKWYIPAILSALFIFCFVWTVGILRKEDKTEVRGLVSKSTASKSVAGFVPDYLRLPYRNLRKQLWNNLVDLERYLLKSDACLQEEAVQEHLIRIHTDIDNILRRVLTKINPGDSSQRIQEYIETNVVGVSGEVYSKLAVILVVLDPVKNNEPLSWSSADLRSFLLGAKKASKKLWVRNRLWMYFVFKVRSFRIIFRSYFVRMGQKVKVAWQFSIDKFVNAIRRLRNR